MENKIVMRDGPQAAQYRTNLKGWFRVTASTGDGAKARTGPSPAAPMPCDRCGAPT